MCVVRGVQARARVRARWVRGVSVCSVCSTHPFLNLEPPPQNFAKEGLHRFQLVETGHTWAQVRHEVGGESRYGGRTTNGHIK
jgi:hypothetical protein